MIGAIEKQSVKTEPKAATMLTRRNEGFNELDKHRDATALEYLERSTSVWTANLSAAAITALCGAYVVKSVAHFVCGAASQWRGPDQHAIEMATACANPAVRSELGERCHHFEWLGSSVGFLYAGFVELQEHTYTCGVVSCSSFIPDGLGTVLFAVSVTLIIVALCMFRCARTPDRRQMFVEDAYPRRQSVRISEVVSGGSGSSSDEYTRERRKIKS